MWEQYRARMNHLGNSYTDRILQQGIRDFSYFLTISPTVHAITIGSQSHQVSIQSELTKQKVGFDEKIVLAALSTPIGPGVYFTWNGGTWLTVLEMEKSYNTHRRLIARKCNTISNVFVDGKTISIPCCFAINLTRDSLFNEILRETLVVDVKDYNGIVTIGRNSDTEKIARYTRFMFDGRTWEVQEVNSNFIENIIILVVKLVLTDDQIDNAATQTSIPVNYNPPEVSVTQQQATDVIEYKLQSTNELITNESYTFIATKLVNGVDSLQDFVFAIVNDTLVTILNTTNNSIQIQGNVLGSFTIQVKENGSDTVVLNHTVTIKDFGW